MSGYIETGYVVALSTLAVYAASLLGRERRLRARLPREAENVEPLGGDNTQSNSGGVVSNASFSGNNGFDAASSATAMGNAATGFACSDCNGVVNVNNNQMNSGGVSATSTIDIAAPNRSVNASATAVGNNATFYVSKPSH